MVDAADVLTWDNRTRTAPVAGEGLPNPQAARNVASRLLAADTAGRYILAAETPPHLLAAVVDELTVVELGRLYRAMRTLAAADLVDAAVIARATRGAVHRGALNAALTNFGCTCQRARQARADGTLPDGLADYLCGPTGDLQALLATPTLSGDALAAIVRIVGAFRPLTYDEQVALSAHCPWLLPPTGTVEVIPVDQVNVDAICANCPVDGLILPRMVNWLRTTYGPADVGTFLQSRFDDIVANLLDEVAISPERATAWARAMYSAYPEGVAFVGDVLTAITDDLAAAFTGPIGADWAGTWLWLPRRHYTDVKPAGVDDAPVHVMLAAGGLRASVGWAAHYWYSTGTGPSDDALKLLLDTHPHLVGVALLSQSWRPSAHCPVRTLVCDALTHAPAGLSRRYAEGVPDYRPAELPNNALPDLASLLGPQPGPDLLRWANSLGLFTWKQWLTGTLAGVPVMAEQVGDWLPRQDLPPAEVADIIARSPQIASALLDAVGTAELVTLAVSDSIGAAASERVHAYLQDRVGDDENRWAELADAVAAADPDTPLTELVGGHGPR